jgi:hypothetical protein
MEEYSTANATYINMVLRTFNARTSLLLEVVRYLIVNRHNSVKVCPSLREGLNQAAMSARNIDGEAWAYRTK